VPEVDGSGVRVGVCMGCVGHGDLLSRC